MDCCGHPSNWVTNPWNLSQPRSVYQRSRIKSVTCPFLAKKWSNHQGSPFGFFTRPARGPSCDKLGAWRALPKPTHYAFLCQWIIFTHLKKCGILCWPCLFHFQFYGNGSFWFSHFASSDRGRPYVWGCHGIPKSIPSCWNPGCLLLSLTDWLYFFDRCLIGVWWCAQLIIVIESRLVHELILSHTWGSIMFGAKLPP